VPPRCEGQHTSASVSRDIASCKTDPSVTKDTVFDTQFGLQCRAMSENTITYLRPDQRAVSTENYHPGSAPKTSYQNFRICSDHLQFAILNEVPMRVFYQETKIH